MTDIDERKRAEDALRESERKSRLIVDSIPGFIAAFTPGGELEFVNRPILDYFGKTLEELKRWGTGGMTHPEDLPRVVELFTHSMSSGDPFEFELRARRFDGVYRWFQSRGFPLRDTNGHIVRWYNLLIDIDERKRAEVELRQAYNSFSDGQRLSKTGSFITDLVGDDHNWSEEAYSIFEFIQRRRSRCSVFETSFIRTTCRRSNRSSRARMTGADVTFAFRIVTTRATVKHVRGVAHVIEKAEGRPMFIGALQDVTETMVGRGGPEQGPLRTRPCGAGHDRKRIDRLDRPRGQPAALGHHHQRRHLSSNAGGRSSEFDGAGNREANDPRWQPSLRGDHALACAVQQEGVQAGGTRSE